MFRKLSGDVREGYVPSAHGTFVFYGDRNATLAAMLSTRKKLLQSEIIQNPIKDRLENFETINTIHGLGYISLDLNRHPETESLPS